LRKPALVPELCAQCAERLVDDARAIRVLCDGADPGGVIRRVA